MARAKKKKAKSRASKKTTPHWRVVENVVAAVERVVGSTGKWEVTQNVMVAQRNRTRRRQVDVLAVCPSGSRSFRVGIDVKAEKKPLDVEMMEQLRAKATDLLVDRYVVISTSGFTDAAREEAERYGIQAVTLKSEAFAKVFAITEMNFSNLKLEAFGVALRDDVERPPDGKVRNPWIELEDRSAMIDVVAGPHVQNYVNANPALADGASRTLRIADSAGHWKRMHLEGKSYPPPQAIDVKWSVEHTVYTGHTFALEDGSEAFTVVLPMGGVERQLTLVAVPSTKGHSLTLTLADAAPPRVER